MIKHDKNDVIYCLTLAIACLALIIANWAITLIFLNLIAICFGITFNLKIATGIWIGLMTIRAIFKQKKKETW